MQIVLLQIILVVQMQLSPRADDEEEHDHTDKPLISHPVLISL